MYYSAIGLLALLILLIENNDIIFKRNDAFEVPSWRIYRKFLLSVLAYYITDIMWGFFEDKKQSFMLFADTTVYFLAMATGVLFWSKYAVTYLEEKNGFGSFVKKAGLFIHALIMILTIANVFTPVLFTVDANAVYNALPVRYVVLASQVILLTLISVYALTYVIKRHRANKKADRYRTIAFFSFIMAFFLTVQIWFPYLPLYAIAFLLGTSLLRAYVIGDEKEEYRSELKEAEKVKALKQSITSLLDNMPALSFSKDAETGIYLACNQAFAEYAHKESPEGVVGLTDDQIFDAETAKHFVEDDRMALSMDEPYIFYEDVPDAAGNQRQFQTTKLKYIDSLGRLCTLGMCQDVTDMVRIQRENATTKEAYEKARNNGIIFTHIAQTLARGYEQLYYVNIETDEFIEYHTDENSGTLDEIRRGEAFFRSCRNDIDVYIHPDDRDALKQALTKENLTEALDRSKTFSITYRLLSGQEPVYVSMTVFRMEDDERFIIIGIKDVDEELKRRRAVEQIREEHIAYSRLNALAGDFLCVYVIIPETGNYREFSASEGINGFGLSKEGKDFFETTRKNVPQFIHPDDLERFESMFTKETVMSEIENNGIFAMSYRINLNGRYRYVQLKATMIEENDGTKLIAGLNDIDYFVRQEEEYAKRLAQAQKIANIDALTGVKTKHAYLGEEEKLNRMIEEQTNPDFAIVVLDLNNLKVVNDTLGHQAGDRYIRDACKIICDTFKRSPVFRVGGDEFTVIVQGDDYQCIDELVGKINEHNKDALINGGVVVACGMSQFMGDKCVNSVFERADAKMYENKNRLKALKKQAEEL